jgi:hypothetical protein
MSVDKMKGEKIENKKKRKGKGISVTISDAAG